MKRIRTLLLVFCLNLIGVGLFAQGGQLSEDELSSLKKLAEYNKTWNQFLNIWAILGPILGALATYLSLKARVQKWAEEEVTKKASEKFGLDWGIIKQLVDEKKRDLAIKAKRLAIINKETGRRQELFNMLDKYGFKNPGPQFFTLAEYNAKFDYNQFDVVVLDNHDNKLSETELRQIIDKHQFPYVLFTIEQTSKTFFEEYKGRVKFAQIQQNIPDYIAQSF